AAWSERVIGNPVDETDEFGRERRQIERRRNGLELGAGRHLRAAGGPHTAHRPARAQRNRHDFAGRRGQPVGNAVSIGRIDGHRHEHIDGSFAHGSLGWRPESQSIVPKGSAVILARLSREASMRDKNADPFELACAAIAAVAAKDVPAAARRWLGFIAHERRLSPKTLEAYTHDVAGFLGFLAEHLGGKPPLKQLSALAPADVRAYLARRRRDNIGARTLMRSLAAARSFAHFLEREGRGKVAALAAVRGPKIQRSLPKPLSIKAAREVSDPASRSGEEREPWVLARDAAVLALLYGSGLRISEALGILTRDAPTSGGQVTVLGKGNKTRMVPVLPQVAQAVA